MPSIKQNLITQAAFIAYVYNDEAVPFPRPTAGLPASDSYESYLKLFQNYTNQQLEELIRWFKDNRRTIEYAFSAKAEKNAARQARWKETTVKILTNFFKDRLKNYPNNGLGTVASRCVNDSNNIEEILTPYALVEAFHQLMTVHFRDKPQDVGRILQQIGKILKEQLVDTGVLTAIINNALPEKNNASVTEDELKLCLIDALLLAESAWAKQNPSLKDKEQYALASWALRQYRKQMNDALEGSKISLADKLDAPYTLPQNGDLNEAPLEEQQAVLKSVRVKSALPNFTITNDTTLDLSTYPVSLIDEDIIIEEVLATANKPGRLILFLQQHPELTTLDVSGNYFTDVAGEALQQAILAYPNLITVRGIIPPVNNSFLNDLREKSLQNTQHLTKELLMAARGRQLISNNLQASQDLSSIMGVTDNQQQALINANREALEHANKRLQLLKNRHALKQCQQLIEKLSNICDKISDKKTTVALNELIATILKLKETSASANYDLLVASGSNLQQYTQYIQTAQRILKSHDQQLTAFNTWVAEQATNSRPEESIQLGAAAMAYIYREELIQFNLSADQLPPENSTYQQCKDFYQQKENWPKSPNVVTKFLEVRDKITAFSPEKWNTVVLEEIGNKIRDLNIPEEPDLAAVITRLLNTDMYLADALMFPQHLKNMQKLREAFTDDADSAEEIEKGIQQTILLFIETLKNSNGVLEQLASEYLKKNVKFSHFNKAYVKSLLLQAFFQPFYDYFEKQSAFDPTAKTIIAVAWKRIGIFLTQIDQKLAALNPNIELSTEEFLQNALSDIAELPVSDEESHAVSQLYYNDNNWLEFPQSKKKSDHIIQQASRLAAVYKELQIESEYLPNTDDYVEFNYDAFYKENLRQAKLLLRTLPESALGPKTFDELLTTKKTTLFYLNHLQALLKKVKALKAELANDNSAQWALESFIHKLTQEIAAPRPNIALQYQKRCFEAAHILSSTTRCTDFESWMITHSYPDPQINEVASAISYIYNGGSYNEKIAFYQNTVNCADAYSTILQFRKNLQLLTAEQQARWQKVVVHAITEKREKFPKKPISKLFEDDYYLGELLVPTELYQEAAQFLQKIKATGNIEQAAQEAIANSARILRDKFIPVLNQLNISEQEKSQLLEACLQSLGEFTQRGVLGPERAALQLYYNKFNYVLLSNIRHNVEYAVQYNPLETETSVNKAILRNIKDNLQTALTSLNNEWFWKRWFTRKKRADIAALIDKTTNESNINGTLIEANSILERTTPLQIAFITRVDQFKKTQLEKIVGEKLFLYVEDDALTYSIKHADNQISSGKLTGSNFGAIVNKLNEGTSLSSEELTVVKGKIPGYHTFNRGATLETVLGNMSDKPQTFRFYDDATPSSQQECREKTLEYGILSTNLTYREFIYGYIPYDGILDLSGYEPLQRSDIASLDTLLTEHPELTGLNLSNNTFSDESDVDSLITLLKNHPQILVLNVGKTLSDSANTKIIQQLDNNRQTIISNNDTSDETHTLILERATHQQAQKKQLNTIKGALQTQLNVLNAESWWRRYFFTGKQRAGIQQLLTSIEADLHNPASCFDKNHEYTRKAETILGPLVFMAETKAEPDNIAYMAASISCQRDSTTTMQAQLAYYSELQHATAARAVVTLNPQKGQKVTDGRIASEPSTKPSIIQSLRAFVVYNRQAFNHKTLDISNKAFNDIHIEDLQAFFMQNPNVTALKLNPNLTDEEALSIVYLLTPVKHLRGIDFGDNARISEQTRKYSYELIAQNTRLENSRLALKENCYIILLEALETKFTELSNKNHDAIKQALIEHFKLYSEYNQTDKFSGLRDEILNDIIFSDTSEDITVYQQIKKNLETARNSKKSQNRYFSQNVLLIQLIKKLEETLPKLKPKTATKITDLISHFRQEVTHTTDTQANRNDWYLRWVNNVLAINEPTLLTTLNTWWENLLRRENPTPSQKMSEGAAAIAYIYCDVLQYYQSCTSNKHKLPSSINLPTGEYAYQSAIEFYKKPENSDSASALFQYFQSHRKTLEEWLKQEHKSQAFQSRRTEVTVKEISDRYTPKLLQDQNVDGETTRIFNDDCFLNEVLIPYELQQEQQAFLSLIQQSGNLETAVQQYMRNVSKILYNNFVDIPSQVIEKIKTRDRYNNCIAKVGNEEVLRKNILYSVVGFPLYQASEIGAKDKKRAAKQISLVYYQNRIMGNLAEQTQRNIPLVGALISMNRSPEDYKFRVSVFGGNDIADANGQTRELALTRVFLKPAKDEDNTFSNDVTLEDLLKPFNASAPVTRKAMLPLPLPKNLDPFVSTIDNQQTLNLGYIKLDDSDIPVILRYLETHSEITVVDLGKNRFTQAGREQLKNAMANLQYDLGPEPKTYMTQLWERLYSIFSTRTSSLSGYDAVPTSEEGDQNNNSITPILPVVTSVPPTRTSSPSNYVEVSTVDLTIAKDKFKPVLAKILARRQGDSEPTLSRSSSGGRISDTSTTSGNNSDDNSSVDTSNTTTYSSTLVQLVPTGFDPVTAVKPQPFQRQSSKDTIPTDPLSNGSSNDVTRISTAVGKTYIVTFNSSSSSSTTEINNLPSRTLLSPSLGGNNDE